MYLYLTDYDIRLCHNFDELGVVVSDVRFVKDQN